jgi:outer membrane protein assembly factor BamA
MPLNGAEAIGGVGTAPSRSGQAGDASADGRKSELIFAPIPVSSEAVGTGLAPVAALVFFPSSSDRISPPSTLAVAGVITSTKTYGLGVAGLFNLKEDRYRLTFLVGGARARYEFFGIGNSAATAGQSVWLSQRGRAIFLQGLRRIKWNVFGGLRFSQRRLRSDNEASLDNLSPLPPIQDQLNLSITTAGMGIRLERDTRDDIFYPTRGSRVNGRADFFGPYVGSQFTFQSYQFEINDYIPIAKGHVLAVRAMGCGVAGSSVPFFELCQFGWMGDLRGYQTGRYRDRAMVAAQGEWRVILTKRLGAALFGGVGEVAPDGASFNAEDLLPSGGAGLRFNLSKQRRINLRLDAAYSKTGASWSMGLAEAF